MQSFSLFQRLSVMVIPNTAMLSLLQIVYVSIVLLAPGECQLTPGEEQEILDTHNMLRGMVSPTAANMERMVSNHDA